MSKSKNQAVRSEDAPAYGGAQPVAYEPTAAERAVLMRATAILERVARSRGDMLQDPDAAGRWIQHALACRPAEVFAVLFLDTRHRVIAFEEMFHGTIDGAQVHPREVVRRALHWNAAAVILAHNHPSGMSEPSAADRAITQRLREALALVDVRVLDHLIVGDGQPLSFAARGLL